jgi:plastocyanin
MPMDPKKNRRWVIAGLAAAAVVFLIMATGEWTAPAPAATSADAVLTSDGGSSDGSGSGANATDGGSGEDDGDVDRDAVIDSLQELLDVLGINAQELVDCSEADSAANQNGCGNAGRATDQRAEQTAATITIANFAFGQPITVAPGATVTVRNTDTAPHNVTATDGGFATRNIGQNESVTFTAPTRPGRYAFSCTLHPEMTGTLIVEDANGSGGNAGREERNGAGASTGRSSAPPAEEGHRETDASSTNGAGGHGATAPTQSPKSSSGQGSGDGY